MATKKSKRYAEGGVAEGVNSSIGDDVRSRAMAAMAARDQDIGGGGSTGTTPVVKPVAKPAPKLAKPDYSNEDLDKMGIDDGSGKINKAKALQDAKDGVSGKGISFGKSQRTVAAERAGKPKAAAPVKKAFKASTDESDAYKKGGKAAGRLATRGYGIAKGSKK